VLASLHVSAFIGQVPQEFPSVFTKYPDTQEVTALSEQAFALA
jgi:hypothetical protein